MDSESAEVLGTAGTVRTRSKFSVFLCALCG